MNVIEELESREMAKCEVQIPEFSSGDTVKVSVNVIEGERKRVQAFEELFWEDVTGDLIRRL